MELLEKDHKEPGLCKRKRRRNRERRRQKPVCRTVRQDVASGGGGEGVIIATIIHALDAVNLVRESEQTESWLVSLYFISA